MRSLISIAFIISFSLIISSCSPKFSTKWTTEIAPDTFKARFETTVGNFDIEAKREWSPKAVDRLYQLIKHEYYTDVAFYRVIPGFVAQFGINNDREITEAWRSITFWDEPVVQPNEKGAIAFARGGPETRTTDLFINLESNSPRLDTITYNGVKGFPVIARVISGMEVVESIYDGYGPELDDKQDIILEQGNTYLKENYPELDYIIKAYIIE